MKIKNAKLSLLILIGLVISSCAFFALAQERSNTSNNIFLDSDQDGLSDEEEKTYGTDPRNPDTDNDGYSDGAEIKSGYDPTKPAPGDKIIGKGPAKNEISTETNEENITKEVAKKISALTSSANPEDQEISIEEIKGLVDEVLNKGVADQELPPISQEEIKIKKQNYAGLSEAEAKARKKEDFSNYLVAVYYILSSNSPRPITSASDMNDIADSVSRDIITALSTRNPQTLQNLSESGEKILTQLKDLEVPEELVDIHLKGMQFAQYAIKLQGYLAPNSEDPLADIANLSKIQGFIEVLMGFSSEIQNKFAEYGLQYDEALRGKIKSFGIEAPETIPGPGSSTSNSEGN